ncbi:helix-turn-helix domain-containing protein [Zhihengliuella alba]|uniref:Helix-turn-helix domain-containing protein n=1 Tax=Zhihengliuella alba TaxID=547018 RepID=A0ABP7E348_9MICC
MYQLHTATDFHSWQRLVSNSFVPLEARPVAGGSFRGSVGGGTVADVGMMRIDAAPQRVERTPARIAEGRRGFYKLSIQLAGTGLLAQDGRETVLRPGDLAIYDTQRPYTITYEEEFSAFVLMFPQHMLGLSAPDVAELTAVSMGQDQRLGGAIGPFLREIGGLLPTLDGPIGHRLATNTVDLLGTLLADEIGSRDMSEALSRGRQLRRVQHFIEGQLGNPELSPGLVAAEHYMSTRSLHKLFADSGHTVAEWIRTRRLENCRRDLADPLQADVPVGAIGARWGLIDAAHFSRAFRTAYGASPAAYRKGVHATAST